MSRYVDGFVLPLPKKNLARYRRIARVAGKVWRDHGALEYVECVADQLTSKHEGKTFTSLFPKLAKVKPGEVVVFSWIIYKSKADQKRIMKGDGGSAARQVDGSHALRHEPYGLGRLQTDCRSVRGAAHPPTPQRNIRQAASVNSARRPARAASVSSMSRLKSCHWPFMRRDTRG